MELEFQESDTKGIWFITAGLIGIFDGTIVVTESLGTLLAVGKVCNNKPVTLTDRDRKILRKHHIEIHENVNSIPFMIPDNLRVSSEPIDIPMSTKITSNKDRLVVLAGYLYN